MENIIEQIEKISDKKSFLLFLEKLITDYRENNSEWENQSVDEYLDAMVSWIDDYSTSEFNDIDWESIDYSTMAKILYMGKIYE